MPGRLWAGLGRAARAALRSPWPLTCAVLLPFQLLMGWVQWKGLHLEPEPVLSRGVMELWVHGPQPPFAWVPFIHPPGYAVYMNVTDAVAGWLGMSPDALVLLQGWACRILLVLLVAWAVTRWAGPRAGLLAASLVALSPNGLRPFEHYPIATVLATVAMVAIVELVRHGGRRASVLAVVAVLAAVMIHLSTWFVVGGAMAAAFFFVSGRRKEAAAASVAMIGLFLLASLTGLWRVLGTGMGDDPERTSGVATIEWTNPWLFVPLLLWLVPAFFRRDRGGAVLAGGVALFTGITMALQSRQIADGQPYPSSLHYFELIDPTLAIAATLALVAVARSGVWWRRLAISAGLVLLASQAMLLLEGQQWVFLNRFWFWMILWPFG